MGFDQGPKFGLPVFPKGKAAQLSVDHINEIAELSNAYLNSEAVEFSEEQLVSNLYLLSVVARRVKHNMAKKDTQRIDALASAIFGNALTNQKK
jgi:hypothetical protein